MSPLVVVEGPGLVRVGICEGRRTGHRPHKFDFVTVRTLPSVRLMSLTTP